MSARSGVDVSTPAVRSRYEAVRSSVDAVLATAKKPYLAAGLIRKEGGQWVVVPPSHDGRLSKRKLTQEGDEVAVKKVVLDQMPSEWVCELVLEEVRRALGA